MLQDGGGVKKHPCSKIFFSEKRQIYHLIYDFLTLVVDCGQLLRQNFFRTVGIDLFFIVSRGYQLPPKKRTPTIYKLDSNLALAKATSATRL